MPSTGHLIAGENEHYYWLEDPTTNLKNVTAEHQWKKPTLAGLPSQAAVDFTAYAEGQNLQEYQQDMSKTFLDLDESSGKHLVASTSSHQQQTVNAGATDSTSGPTILGWLTQKTPTEDQRMFAQGFQEAYQDVVKRERNPSSERIPLSAHSSSSGASGGSQPTPEDKLTPEHLPEDYGGDDYASCRVVPSTGTAEEIAPARTPVTMEQLTVETHHQHPQQTITPFMSGTAAMAAGNYSMPPNHIYGGHHGHYLLHPMHAPSPTQQLHAHARLLGGDIPSAMSPMASSPMPLITTSVAGEVKNEIYPMEEEDVLAYQQTTTPSPGRMRTDSRPKRLSSGGRLLVPGAVIANAGPPGDQHVLTRQQVGVVSPQQHSNHHHHHRRIVVDKRYSHANRMQMAVQAELVSEETAVKIEKKRERNRIAASKCRMKKVQRIMELEKRVDELMAENEMLRKLVPNYHQLFPQSPSSGDELMGSGGEMANRHHSNNHHHHYLMHHRMDPSSPSPGSIHHHHQQAHSPAPTPMGQPPTPGPMTMAPGGGMMNHDEHMVGDGRQDHHGAY